MRSSVATRLRSFFSLALAMVLTCSLCAPAAWADIVPAEGESDSAVEARSDAQSEPADESEPSLEYGADEGDIASDEGDVSLPVEDVEGVAPIAGMVSAATTRTYVLPAATLSNFSVATIVSGMVSLAPEQTLAGSDEAGEDSAAVEAEQVIPTISTTYVAEGCVYVLDRENGTFALVNAANAKLSEEGYLLVPSALVLDDVTYPVTSIAAGALFGTDADLVALSKNINNIDEDASAGADNLQAVFVSDVNETYSSYDGCLYDKPLTSLLLVPEGKLGTVRIPSGVETISPEAFSHCAFVDAVFADADSAAFQSLEDAKIMNALGGVVEIVTQDAADEYARKDSSGSRVSAVVTLSENFVDPVSQSSTCESALNSGADELQLAIFPEDAFDPVLIVSERDIRKIQGLNDQADTSDSVDWSAEQLLDDGISLSTRAIAAGNSTYTINPNGGWFYYQDDYDKVIHGPITSSVSLPTNGIHRTDAYTAKIGCQLVFQTGQTADGRPNRHIYVFGASQNAKYNSKWVLSGSTWTPTFENGLTFDPNGFTFDCSLGFRVTRKQSYQFTGAHSNADNIGYLAFQDWGGTNGAARAIAITPETGYRAVIRRSSTTVYIAESVTPLPVTVTFNGNGGTASVASKSVERNAAYGTLPSAERSGYYFMGWSLVRDDYSLASRVTSSTQMTKTANHDLYALWGYKGGGMLRWNGGMMTNLMNLHDTYAFEVKSDMSIQFYSIHGDRTSSVAEDCTRSVVGYRIFDRAAGDYVYFREPGVYPVKPEYTVAGDDYNFFLYALWDVYSVSFDPNLEGASVDPSMKMVEFGKMCGVLPTPTENSGNVVFAGWYTTPNAPSSFTQVTESTVANNYSDITLYAHWQRIAGSCIDANSGQLQGEIERLQYTTEFLVNEDMSLVRRGIDDTDTLTCSVVDEYARKLIGWKVKEYGYDADDSASWRWMHFTEPGSYVMKHTYRDSPGHYNVTFYAVWKDSTVTFDPNLSGVSVSPATKQVTFGESYGNLPSPTADGYAFGGWYLDQECTSKQITASTVADYGGDQTLYAKWTPTSGTAYTVNHHKQSFNAADGLPIADAWQSPEVESKTGMTDATVTPGVKTYPGYTSPTTQTATIANDGSLVVDYYYALDVYTISYDLASGSLAAGATNPVFYTIETPAIALNNPAKTGYGFTGWTGTDLEGLSSSVIVPKGSMGDRSYVANYEIETYPISYTLAGGTQASGQVSNYTVEDLPITLADPSRFGYDFAGWTLDGSGAATDVDAVKGYVINVDTVGALAFTAHWSAQDGINYTVRHWRQSLGGDVDIHDQSNYELADTDTLTGKVDEVLTPDRKTYEGFTAPSGQQLTVTLDGSASVDYYYARNSYAVSIAPSVDGFDYTNTVISVAPPAANMGVAGEHVFEYGSQVTLAPVMDDAYRLLSWDVQPVGLAITSGGEGNTQGTISFVMPASNVALTPKTEIKQFRIRFEANGGSLEDGTSVSDQEVVVGDKPQNPGEMKKSGGYVFGGWYKESDFKTPWNWDVDVMPAADMTLYAYWIEVLDATVPDSVTFMLDIATGDVSSNDNERFISSLSPGDVYVVAVQASLEDGASDVFGAADVAKNIALKLEANSKGVETFLGADSASSVSTADLDAFKIGDHNAKRLDVTYEILLNGADHFDYADQPLRLSKLVHTLATGQYLESVGVIDS